ncbi:hypothetical protein LRP49_04630 [Enterovibrio sp. ZSDZ35]|uniref:Uncharacterized protein n=1 Tax=Enterovibrio qingdaonensis TaxID=2899818 RepID=A0ABT5QJL4_9GAMM|nr:hypothetical protein [Enterovibrio sp. ZSDZ35]MDD1780481.1 hypothetical protein [Enterovibrio sp. ZSDZ35]
MAKASTVLKKHVSLVAEMQKAAKPNSVKNPLIKTREAATAQKSRVESRITELEQQRAAFNKKIDEAIEREKKQLSEIGRFEDMVKEKDSPTTDVKPEPTPKPRPKPKPKPRTPRVLNVDTDAIEKATAKRKVTTPTTKRRTTKK